MADKATAVPSESDSRRSPSPPERIKSSAAEDPDTAAARREFDNTQISEKPNPGAIPMSAAPQPAEAAASEAKKRKTPELEVPYDTMKDQISSPKKKRAHDELEQSKDAAQDPNGDVSPIGANGSSASLSRSDRSEPEKKRPRDVSSEAKAQPVQDAAVSIPFKSPILCDALC
jgi:Ran-binding protein 3